MNSPRFESSAASSDPLVENRQHLLVPLQLPESNDQRRAQELPEREQAELVAELVELLLEEC